MNFPIHRALLTFCAAVVVGAVSWSPAQTADSQQAKPEVKECKSTVYVDKVFKAAMGESVKKTAVFANGRLVGVRLRGSGVSSDASRIPDASIITHICGVHMEQIKQAESVCCDIPPDADIPVTVDVNGKSHQALIPLDR